MKFAIIIPDGAADEPVEALSGSTPLEAARTPHMDWIATNGRQGTVMTTPPGFPPGTDVAVPTILGYDPNKNHLSRAGFEAMARGISIDAGQIAFCCNFVTLVDGVMEDPTAGHLSQREAGQLISDLNARCGDASCRFHCGSSDRNLMIVTMPAGAAPVCTPLHDLPGRPIKSHLPQGPGARRVTRLLERAHNILADNDVNVVRRDLGENPATDIWLWGQGRSGRLPLFFDRFQVTGTVVAAVDIMRGIAKAVGLETHDVAGATGYLDTDYAAKGTNAVVAFDDFDLVVVHIAAPDEAGHSGDLAEKIRAIEQVDEFVVGPLLEKAKSFDKWRVMVVPDHATPVARRTHSSQAVPFCFAGSAVQGTMNRPFGETAARASDLQIEKGWHLMEYFLRS